jgi:polyisoprenoid-binding protein YceI
MSSQSTAIATADLALPTGTWQVDPIHSSVEFHVKHLGIATVKGHFNEFEGTVDVTPEGTNAYGNVKAASVDTRQTQRDDHLRSPDFFEVDTYPEIAFQSTGIVAKGEDEFAIEGDLTIHGVTRPISLEASLEGTETDAQGNDRVGLSASTQINRSDFDIKFNAALGSGNAMVSDKVKILLDISAIRAA